MSRMYMAHGQFEKAAPLAEQSLSKARLDNVSDEELALCLVDLGYIYAYTDKLDDAQQMCSLGIQLQQKALSEDHPYIAYSLRTMALIYRNKEMFDEAKEALDRAMEIMLQTNDADSNALAPFKVDFAELLAVQGKTEEAEAMFVEALNGIDKSFGRKHVYSAKVMASLAKLYVIEGKYDQARTLIDEALEVQKEVYGENHRMMTSTWLTLAMLDQATGQESKSDLSFKKAITAVTEFGTKQEQTAIKQNISDIRTGDKTYFVTAM